MNRQNVISVRFTDVEAAKLADLAKKRGVSEGLLLRELVRNARADVQKVIVWSVTSHVETTAGQLAHAIG